MRNRIGLTPIASLMLTAGLCVTAPNALLADNNTNPRVLPPNSVPHGLTYGEWSAEWWKWALEKSTADSPLLDTTGANCAVGQSGSVWFLAGTFGTSNAVTRSCTVPLGRMLFFPVGNAFCAAEGDFVQMRACATSFMNSATDLRAEIDGVAVQELDRYRVVSPEFALALPADNIFGVPAGIYNPAAADGVYLMLAPLQAGSHTIHFHARFSDSEVEVTYHITVATAGSAAAKRQAVHRWV